jgi:hypothetical protein
MRRVTVLKGTFWPGDLLFPGGLRYEPWIIIDAGAAVADAWTRDPPRPAALRLAHTDPNADDRTILCRWPYAHLGTCLRPT